jgi:hypothetical protein
VDYKRFSGKLRRNRKFLATAVLKKIHRLVPNFGADGTFSIFFQLVMARIGKRPVCARISFDSRRNDGRGAPSVFPMEPFSVYSLLAMTPNDMRFVSCSAEFQSKDEIEKMPKGIRGIYALLKRRPRLRKKYDVVYIGMARRGAGGVRARLLKHRRSKKKGRLWTHFSVYSVWPRVPDAEIVELEGLFRHIYRRDTRANKLATQKTFGPLRATRQNNFQRWERR